MQHTFTSRNGGFFFDGSDFHLISGAIHYFRVPQEYWLDRLEKLVAQGCNAVETYLPWNLHEPRPGQFDFSGQLDVVTFLELAGSLGLKAIVRPSPYTCGEWEFGGQPWWLLKDPLLRVRTLEGAYSEAVKRYYAELLPRLVPLQCTHGGPIIACQIENEYGYFGNDRSYLEFLKEQLCIGGIDVLLFTTDGPWGLALEAGSLPGVLAGGSFGSGAPEHFARMRKLRPGDPLICSEFWMGWFDAWGDKHHVREVEDAANTLDAILAEGHVNLYMFHGGTNFGFFAGANHYEELKPDVTSYDYDAPLSESGGITPKFRAFRQVIQKRARDPEVQRRLAIPLDSYPFSTKIQAKALGKWPVSATTSLTSALPKLGKGRVAARPLSMEELDQGYGYVLYRIKLSGPRPLERMVLWKCHDRATVYVNGTVVLAQTGNEVGTPFALDLPLESNSVEILVENQGRVNFGEKMNDQRKGILGAVIVDKHAFGPVESWGLPLDSLEKLPWSADPARPGVPGFSRVLFEGPADLDRYTDTHLLLDGWGKGVAWVNGKNLGRFWEIGPQRTLYVPGPWLHPGTNELVLFESEGRSTGLVEFVEESILT